MAWSSKKFENNIITTIVKKKVELHARVQNTEEIIHKIKKLYNILCDMSRFTNDFQENIQHI